MQPYALSAVIGKRYPQLAAFQESLVSKRPGLRGLRLIGSWANGEACIRPKFDGSMDSLSDVDFICTHIRSAADQQRLIADVKLAAARARLRLAGSVSLRKKELISRLPIGQEWGLECDGPEPVRRPTLSSLVLFWAAIGAIEAEITLMRGKSSGFEDEAVRSYAFCKLAFGLFRNIAIVNGSGFNSYRAVTRWVSNRWPGLPIRSAYHVKTASSLFLSPVDVNQLLSGYLECYEIQYSISTVSYFRLCDLLSHTNQFVRGRCKSDVSGLFDLAHRYSYAEVTDEVINHARRKFASATSSDAQ
jgi:hypothetical protein